MTIEEHTEILRQAKMDALKRLIVFAAFPDVVARSRETIQLIDQRFQEIGIQA